MPRSRGDAGLLSHGQGVDAVIRRVRCLDQGEEVPVAEARCALPLLSGVLVAALEGGGEEGKAVGGSPMVLPDADVNTLNSELLDGAVVLCGLCVFHV